MYVYIYMYITLYIYIYIHMLYYICYIIYMLYYICYIIYIHYIIYIEDPQFFLALLAAWSPSAKAKGALWRIPAELAAGTQPVDAVEHPLESSGTRPVAGHGMGLELTGLVNVGPWKTMGKPWENGDLYGKSPFSLWLNHVKFIILLVYRFNELRSRKFSLHSIHSFEKIVRLSDLQDYPLVNSHNYGQLPFLRCKPTNFLWPFSSSQTVSLPEGRIFLDKAYTPVKTEFSAAMSFFRIVDVMFICSRFVTHLDGNFMGIPSFSDTPVEWSLRHVQFPTKLVTIFFRHLNRNGCFLF